MDSCLRVTKDESIHREPEGARNNVHYRARIGVPRIRLLVIHHTEQRTRFFVY